MAHGFDIGKVVPLVGEKWAPIPVRGYSDYRVSNKGRVLSGGRFITNRKGKVRYWKAKLLKLQVSWNGYVCVHICGKGRNFWVHRLVALAFISRSRTRKFVNHKDGNKQNNIASNLEWCSRSENVRHGYDTGLIVKPKGVYNGPMGGKHHASTLRDDDVRRIRRLRKDGVYLREIGRRYGICAESVRYICYRGWKHVK